ncbi:MAG: serine/threonine-protein phosphatase [Nannocystis sp.]|nr:PP2C family serine/threonine-protein phosphatase [Nannocystis sp.]MBA3548665.1 serine/threonine-protein phosphatase [Nannocystis sp.]
MTGHEQHGPVWAGEAVQGVGREALEDTFRGDAGVWIVVDAFGGDGSGAYAAQLVAAELGVPGEARERFAAARARLSAAISPNGAGASVVRLVIDGMQAEIAWLGRCRAYLIRDAQVLRMTRDHTLVEQWLDEGRVTPADVDGRFDNILVRAVMGCMDDDPELVRIELRPGDRILLVSDGVWRVLDEQALYLPVPEAAAPAQMVRALVAAVVHRGGTDDATAVVVALP